MRKFLLSGAAMLASIGLAHAAPITTNPGSLIATGSVDAVFAFSDAANQSQLLKLNVAGVIFDNKVDAVGTKKNIGNNTGLIQFVLFNDTTKISFINDVADTGPGGDTYFHAKYGTSAADFGLASFSTATNNAIATLQGTVQYVGFEDVRGGDYDYNDLIFAFSAVRAVEVPEPASIAMLGLGLFGFGMLRRTGRV